MFVYDCVWYDLCVCSVFCFLVLLLSYCSASPNVATDASVFAAATAAASASSGAGVFVCLPFFVLRCLVWFGLMVACLFDCVFVLN